MLRIGIDLGGTKIEAMALDGAREVFRKRVVTPRGDYGATIAAVAALVHEIGEGSVGVGIPGALKGAGTGVGGGIVAHGKLLAGANAIAGEWGHNPLPAPTPLDLPLLPCYCGRMGCIETYLSGPGLAWDHQTLTGERRTAAEIVALQGEALRRYEERLARALASVINVLDPDVIVLGGGMSNAARLCTEVPRLWSQPVFSDQRAPPPHALTVSSSPWTTVRRGQSMSRTRPSCPMSAWRSPPTGACSG